MIIDTDVLVRFFTNDDVKKATRFREFLISGQNAELTDVTVAELFWVLRSFYHFSKADILIAIETLLNKKSIQCNQEILKLTVDLLKKRNISFIDAYTVAYSLVNSDGVIMSFDKGLAKIKGVKRIEP